MRKKITWIPMLALVCVLALGGCTGGGGGNEGSGGGSTPHKSSTKPHHADEPCHYNGHQLHVGPKGGCFYYYDGKKKEYVDHSYCKDCK